jgi:DNA-binding CsgD family transcriptional regulator
MTGVELGSAAPAGLLERDHELATARAWLDEVSAGRGRLLLIEAPAGLGKSSLIEQVRRLASAEFFVLSAAGREVEQDLGWGVARSLFEPWLLRLPADERADLLSGPAASASLLFRADGDPSAISASDVGFGILHGLYWLTARAAETRPALLIVDDAHWADEPSLRLLSYLLGRIDDEPIGLLVAARAREPGAAGLLAQLASERAVSILEPAPLSAAAVSALITARMPDTDAAFARRCWELTAGNPLGVRELLLAIAAVPPDAARPDVDAIARRAARSLSRSVLRRLASLPADARALADAVSVFEARVELQWAAALAGLETTAALAAADQLARVDILTGEDPLAFTHPLLRASVYQALARGRRSQLHRRAASVLLDARASAEQVAGHLLESPPAGDPEVVHLLRSAARQAMAHGVPASAARYLERALREPPSHDTRGGLLAELGRAQAGFAPRQAIEHLEEAMELAEGPSERAVLALELGRALHDAGRPEEACAAFERGTAELPEDAGDLALELEAWYLTSAVLLPERAADVHRRTDAIVARSRGQSTPAVRLLACKSLIMRVYEGEPHGPLAELALELYGDGRLIDEGGVLSQASSHIAGALSYADRYPEALEVLGRSREEARRIGSLTGIAAACQLRARLRHWTGSIPDVIADASTAVEIFSSGQQMYLPASAYCLARGLIEDDQPDEAEAVLARVERDAPPTGIFAAWQHEARGRLAAATGSWERALQEFLACGEWTDTLLVRNPAMFHWRSEAGLAALRLGRSEMARELIEAEAALAARFGAPRAVGVAERAAALLERGPTVESELRSAAQRVRACGAKAELAYTLLELGGAIRRAGRPTEARDTLREALAIAEEIGARRAARLSREELHRAGGRASIRADGADQLTPSERRVAELAAQGRTNREIADELFVTVKAVEWHLGNAYRKLDIRGRGGLADALGKSA